MYHCPICEPQMHNASSYYGNLLPLYWCYYICNKGENVYIQAFYRQTYNKYNKLNWSEKLAGPRNRT